MTRANDPAVATALSGFERIGKEIARAAAADVDTKARFPGETFAALREAGLLAAPLPRELSGLGLGTPELASACSLLAQHCASSGMVFAMHCIKVVSLAHHREGTSDLDEHLREVAREQRLLASVTSEVGPHGDMRQSVCAVQGRGAELALVKQATTISYGAHADELVITARRNAEAAPSDQVLVVAPRGSYALSEVGSWDTLGMRGTCSPPAVVSVRGPGALVLAQPFARIAAESMVPVSHILWSACWLGIAQDAVARVQALVRSQARSAPSSMPRAARRLPELVRKLELVRQSVQTAAHDYQALWDAQDGGQLASVGYALAINNLKLSASELCVEIVLEAVHAAGIVAYKNDSPYALGRNLRDALSAPLMIGNDRIRETNAALLLVYKGT